MPEYNHTVKMIVDEIKITKKGDNFTFRKENAGMPDDLLWLNDVEINDLEIGDEVEVTLTWNK